MDTPTPRRRWFSFSLRTVFAVVTVLAVSLAWIGSQLHWIRQRNEARREGLSFSKLGYAEHAPWPLEWFGETGVNKLVTREADVERAKRLFPEAEIQTVDRLLDH